MHLMCMKSGDQPRDPQISGGLAPLTNPHTNDTRWPQISKHG